MASTSAIRDKLARTIKGDVRFDAAARVVFSTDASNYRRDPIGIIAPRDAADVAAALKIARENDLPIVPRGGGTSLAGQGANTALMIDFSRYMTEIRAIDPDRRIAIVEPGVVQSHLNAAAERYGLFFAPDPSTKDRCTIGGMIGNNSCGAHSAAHGKTADNVVALEAMLYDGTELSLGAAASANEIAAAIASGGRAGEIFSSLRALADRHAHAIRA